VTSVPVLGHRDRDRRQMELEPIASATTILRSDKSTIDCYQPLPFSSYAVVVAVTWAVAVVVVMMTISVVYILFRCCERE
jgi:hypothetical protein